MNDPAFLPRRLDRRTALKWMLAATAALPLARQRLLANSGREPSGHGYGTDPDLQRIYESGNLWPLTFGDEQRQTATVLCDLIIPSDTQSPAASKVGVVDFIDEWISAPYVGQQKDRTLIVGGFIWLEEEAKRRFGLGFADLSPAEHHAICDDICHEQIAKAEFRPAARFFARYRDLTAGGFYTTPAGTADLKYIGNMPLAHFDGPPPEVLRRVGLL